MVQDIVRGSFLLWQQQDKSGYGMRYISFYKPTKYPHIGLLDPRTGQLLETISGYIEPDHFCSRLAEFLDNNSLRAGGTVRSRATGNPAGGIVHRVPGGGKVSQVNFFIFFFNF